MNVYLAKLVIADGGLFLLFSFVLFPNNGRIALVDYLVEYSKEHPNPPSAY
jgi:hypothetical protein